MVNSIFLSILFALFLVLLIILMAKLSKDNIKYLDYVLVLYVIILILYLGLCFWAISKGINYWYVQLIRNLVGLFFYIYFWSLFILLNGLNNRDIHLIPVSSRVEMTIIILLYTFLTILLTISSISLLLFPNEVDFIMVILLVSILSGWINKTFSDIRLMYLFIPTTLLIYIFILAIISIIIRFNLYYQKYELLIFLSISFYFISQTIFDNDYIELYGKKISIILDKNFLRLI